MADIFLSYARADRATMLRLAQAVRGEGYEPWWDDEIPAHVAYGELIAQKINASKAVITLWSASAVASEWVRAESEVARGARKLIQASTDGSMPPLPFNLLQAAPLQGWAGEEDHPGWRQIRSSLAALCGPPSRAAPPPAFPPTPPAAKGRAVYGWLAMGVLIAMLAGLYLWMSREPSPPSSPVALQPVAAPAKPAPSGTPALDGQWSVMWTSGGRFHSGTLGVAGASAVLNVTVLAENLRVRQDCTIAPQGAGAAITCRNPVVMSGSGGYRPDTFSLPRASGNLIVGEIPEEPDARVTFARR